MVSLEFIRGRFPYSQADPEAASSSANWIDGACLVGVL